MSYSTMLNNIIPRNFILINIISCNSILNNIITCNSILSGIIRENAILWLVSGYPKQESQCMTILYRTDSSNVHNYPVQD